MRLVEDMFISTEPSFELEVFLSLCEEQGIKPLLDISLKEVVYKQDKPKYVRLVYYNEILCLIRSNIDLLGSNPRFTEFKIFEE